ncbi:flavodoxin family protein [Fructilactobacillus florum]|uniref:NADPH-dependent FMN reductase-like domain-containing protein n=1 Tax=Fructilactobacillus florum DSM 22689 = JCM 16035 TaxID=1423745 RepID=A0A0R2CKA8_9LACO|nr:NAD(P)H-dependent oxidoreductase [Fructilactobacillus florum]KRM91879.1 hypothetical protein FC87_GL000704 [Fructilactobacillus florum DSM 22689 = JCM 16035]
MKTLIKNKLLVVVSTLIIGVVIGGNGAFLINNYNSYSAASRSSSSSMQFSKPKNNDTKGKRVFLNASQNQDGNTSEMARKLFGNKSYEQINLAAYKIPQVGQGNGDFQTVFDKLKGAKIIVIGTPVYWSNMSGYLKTFIDHLEINDDLKGADLYVIVQGQQTNQNDARQSTYHTLKHVADRFGFNFVGIASDDVEVNKLHAKLINK